MSLFPVSPQILDRSTRWQKSVQELAGWIEENINKNRFLTVEYVAIVDDEKLQPVKSWNEKNTKVACVAAYCGKIRLIDNIVLN